MKNICAIGLCTILLVGCSRAVSIPATPSQEKAVNTTLSGTVSKTGGKFFIAETGKSATELDSYTVKLDQYVGKKISVTGQYSGTTLFVDAVNE